MAAAAAAAVATASRIHAGSHLENSITFTSLSSSLTTRHSTQKLVFRKRIIQRKITPPATSLPRIACGTIKEVTGSDFSDVVLKSNRPVLVEFVATWCGPCRLIAPAIESLAQEYQDKLTIVKVDHDSNPELIQEYKVYGLPALILFINGKEIRESRREGAITKGKLKAYIDGLLESVSVG